MTENFNLKHKWVLWFHKMNENIWTLESYSKIFEITTYYDILFIQKEMKNITAGIFFLMKEGIDPIFEDKMNKDGGYWSLKIPKKDSLLYWDKIMFYLCIDRLTNTDNEAEMLNGLSISPKINNCIFKIWNCNFKKMNLESLRKDLNFINQNEIMYLQHS